MMLNYGRTGCKGLTYDGVNLSDLFQIVDVSIPLLPTVEARVHELAQRTGSYFASRKVGTREIRVKLRLDAETRDPMGIFREWREVSKVLNKPDPRKLSLDEERYCWALLVGETPLTDEAYYGVVELSFVCFDPYFYGEQYEIPLTAGTAASFVTRGTVDAWPFLDLTSTSTQVKVINMLTGEYVLIPDVVSGTRVTVDMETQMCTKGTGYAPYDLLSDFFSLDGPSQVTVEGASGTLAYRERFL